MTAIKTLPIRTCMHLHTCCLVMHAPTSQRQELVLHTCVVFISHLRNLIVRGCIIASLWTCLMRDCRIFTSHAHKVSEAVFMFPKWWHDVTFLRPVPEHLHLIRPYLLVVYTILDDSQKRLRTLHLCRFRQSSMTKTSRQRNIAPGQAGKSKCLEARLASDGFPPSFCRIPACRCPFQTTGQWLSDDDAV